MDIRNRKIQVTADDADLAGSQFCNSNLEESGFNDVNLHASRFTNCNLADAVFKDVNLGNVSISDANIEGLTVDGVPVYKSMAAASNKPGAVIFAKQIERMVAFYEHVLALSNAYSDDDHCVLESTHLQLTLHAIPTPIAETITVCDPPALRSNAAVKLYFPVVSIAHARAQAAAFGGSVNPTDNEWQGRGFRACDGFDPEGNLVQFRENDAGH